MEADLIRLSWFLLCFFFRVFCFKPFWGGLWNMLLQWVLTQTEGAASLKLTSDRLTGDGVMRGRREQVERRRRSTEKGGELEEEGSEWAEFGLFPAHSFNKAQNAATFSHSRCLTTRPPTHPPLLPPHIPPCMVGSSPLASTPAGLHH